MDYIIYMHVNKINGKKYIGQTKNKPSERFGLEGQHYLIRNKNGIYRHPKFARAINKYGWDTFEHIILEECNENNVDEREKFYIALYNSMEDGYNLTSGGSGGGKLSEESRKRISDNQKRRLKNPEYVEYLRNINLGENNHQYGKSLSAETKRKLSERNTGVGNPFYGKKHTSETLEKLKEIGKNCKHEYSQYNKIRRKVRCVETGKIYNSAVEAAEEYGMKSPAHITQCCKGKIKTSFKLHWEYVENY